MDEKTIIQLEMSEKDIELAERAAKKLGYTQTAYTSSSDLIGLFCFPHNEKQKSGCFVKTKQFGIMFMQSLEDLKMYDLWVSQLQDAS